MLRWKSVNPLQTAELHSDLLVEAKIDLSYLILIFTSCAVATFGLLSNSAAVIIGAMIIAPLMLPIRALAFGALEGNTVLFRTGLVSVLLGTVTAVLLSWFWGGITGLTSLGSEIMARTKPTLLDLGIAVAAGGIGGYGKIEPKVSSTVAGTAIAVALMPPLCVIGIGLSQRDWALSQGATLLYATNLLGISLACMVTFVLAGYTPFYQARKPLFGAIALTSVLLIPLSFSFTELVSRARLETSLKKLY